jgi:hypothetical protein
MIKLGGQDITRNPFSPNIPESLDFIPVHVFICILDLQ